MAAEDPAQSALLTDRGLPIGNSEDVFIRRALHVKIGNKPSEAVPVYLTEPGASSDPFFAEGAGAITPGVLQNLITFVVPVAISRLLSQVIVTCRVEGIFEVKAGTTVIGSGRTGAASPQAKFEWDPSRPVAAGVTVVVNFTARAGGPATTVEAYLQASDIPA